MLHFKISEAGFQEFSFFHNSQTDIKGQSLAKSINVEKKIH